MASSIFASAFSVDETLQVLPTVAVPPGTAATHVRRVVHLLEAAAAALEAAHGLDVLLEERVDPLIQEAERHLSLVKVYDPAYDRSLLKRCLRGLMRERLQRGLH